jgi:DNA-binding HxlR family transcriptional regulator
MGSAIPPFQPPTAFCPIERAMAVIWDHWSMLILREIHSGVSEFDEFEANLVVDRKVLTANLEKLVAAGVLEMRECGAPGDRSCPGYYLTAAGRDLSVLLGALQQWGDAHLPLPTGPISQRAHRVTGAAVSVSFVDELGVPVNIDHVRLHESGPEDRPTR